MFEVCNRQLSSTVNDPKTHFQARNMDLDQYFHNLSNEGDNAAIEKWKSLPAGIDPHEDKPTGGFDCNICLDLVHEPVVTLCGHLYCWPCIYKWIHFRSVSNENADDPQQQPQCPVCKSEVSQKTLVPLYGRGRSEGKESPHLGIVVPRRPPSPTCGAHAISGSRPSLHQRRNMQPVPPVLTSGGSTAMAADAFNPMVGMYGEMVYTRMFENSETTMYSGSPNSYRLAGRGSPRLRRHMMEADKSLSRVCFFLCCCIVLCLLLF